jgi:hypothetical protein
MRSPFRPNILGQVELFEVTGAWRPLGVVANAVTFGGMDLIGRLLAGEGRPINGIYLEFENGTEPALVSPPMLDPTAGVEYYLGLSGQRDFVRAPAGLRSAPAGSSSAYRSNRVAFTGQSAHTAGNRGLPFSHTAGTVVFGAALVSLADNPSDDIVYARAYFDANLRIPKQDMMQIGLNWITTVYHPEDTP